MGKKIKRKFTSSSGLRLTRERIRRIKRLKMKIARWDRYRASGKSVSDNAKKRWPSRHDNWNTAGLKKQLAFLEKLV